MAFDVAADRDIEWVTGIAESFAGDREGELADTLTAMLTEGLAAGRVLLLASYSLTIEATRRPSLRAVTTRWSAAWNDAFTAIMHKAGSARPDQHATLLLATLDGLLFAHLTHENEELSKLLDLTTLQVELLLARD